MRHFGQHQIMPHFPTILSATVIADGHYLLIPEFAQRQQDRAAQRPGLRGEERKQGCEINAAQRWPSGHTEMWRPYRPVYLAEDLYGCQPICRLALNGGADLTLVCKPSSHKRLHELLYEDFITSTGWKRVCNHKR